MQLKNLEILVSLLLLFSCLQMNGQENWDEANARYTNHKHHFHWALPPECEWEKHMPAELHTFFRAESPYGMMVMVNINYFEEGKSVPDVWDGFDKYMDMFRLAAEETKKAGGEETTYIYSKKVNFTGLRAIKLLSKNEVHDDARSQSFYVMKYFFIRNNATWQVVLKCMPEVYEAMREEWLTNVFSGFGPNATPYDNQ